MLHPSAVDIVLVCGRALPNSRLENANLEAMTVVVLRLHVFLSSVSWAAVPLQNGGGRGGFQRRPFDRPRGQHEVPINEEIECVPCTYSWLSNVMAHALQILPAFEPVSE